MDIKTIFALARKWAWLVVLGAILGAASGFVYSYFQPLVYQTTTKVMVQRAPDETRGDSYAVYNDLQLAKTYTQLILTDPIVEAVSQKLGFQVFKGQISVKQVPEMLILEITVRDGDPQRAQVIANSLIAVFIVENARNQSGRFSDSEESLQRQIDQIQLQMSEAQTEIATLSEESLKAQQQQVEEQIAALEAEIKQIQGELPLLEGSALQERQNTLSLLQTRYNLYLQAYEQIVILGSPLSGSQSSRQAQLQTTLLLYQQIYTNLLNNYENIRLARLRSTTNVIQVESARLPTAPVQPKTQQNILLGLALGLMLSAGIAFLIEYLDDTLKTPADVAMALNLPVIGMIGEFDKSGRDGGSYVAQQPRSPISEAYRSLRTNLEFASVDKPLRTILITSAGPSEGKTTTAINLALVMAQGGKKVTLVDSDLRRPAIHQKLKLSNRVGLSNLFRSNVNNLSAFQSWESTAVRVIPSGELPPNPAELLASERMSALLELFIKENDVVILDSSPAIVTDPIVLSAKVDGVILIVEPGKTEIGAAQALVEQLRRSGARLLGVVLNPIKRKSAYYYKHYYYSSYYYYDSESHTKKKRQRTNGKPPKSAQAVEEVAEKASSQ